MFRFHQTRDEKRIAATLVRTGRRQGQYITRICDGALKAGHIRPNYGVALPVLCAVQKRIDNRHAFGWQRRTDAIDQPSAGFDLGRSCLEKLRLNGRKSIEVCSLFNPRPFRMTAQRAKR